MHKTPAAVQVRRPTLPPAPARPPKKVRPSLHITAETDALLGRVSKEEGWTKSDLSDYLIRLGETSARAGYYLTPAGEMRRRALAEIQSYPEAERRGTP